MKKELKNFELKMCMKVEEDLVVVVVLVCVCVEYVW